MATIKSFTDLEQSKRLAEILPLESADMHYSKDFDGSWFVDLAEYTSVKIPKYVDKVEEHLLPCWSLAALLDIIPKHIKDYNVLRTDIGEKDFSLWYDEVGYGVNDRLPDITMVCPVDACVAMIEKLHELGML